MKARAYLNVDWPRALDGYSREDHLVLGWGGDITPRMSPEATCEYVYALLNKDGRPNASYARSLSIGDVIKLGDGPGDSGWYAVEGVGFRPIAKPVNCLLHRDDSRTEGHLAEAVRG